jgi:hypothetical protein
MTVTDLEGQFEVVRRHVTFENFLEDLWRFTVLLKGVFITYGVRCLYCGGWYPEERLG